MIPMPRTPKKKPDPAPEPQPPLRKGIPLTIWLSADLHSQLEAFIEGSTVRPSKKAVVEAALKLFFARQGTVEPDE